MTYHRQESITVLLRHISDTIHELKVKERTASFEKIDFPTLTIQIKHVLNDLRTILDYIANDLNDMLVHSNKKVYYPIGRTTEDFLSKFDTKSWCSDIKQKNPDIFKILLYYNSHNDKTFSLLNQLDNERKHRILLMPQSASYKSLGVGKGILISDIENSQTKVFNNTILGNSSSQLVDEVKFLIEFENEGIYAINFLECCKDRIEQLESCVYNELSKL